MTGSLTGSLHPKSSPYIMAGTSPLTAIWSQPHGGGHFARGVQPSYYLKALNVSVGWDMDLDEFLMAGERIHNLKRTFSVRGAYAGRTTFYRRMSCPIGPHREEQGVTSFIWEPC